MKGRENDKGIASWMVDAMLMMMITYDYEWASWVWV
jgi:hypothetical protein